MEDGESDDGNRVDIRGLLVLFGGVSPEPHFTGGLPGALPAGSIDTCGAEAVITVKKPLVNQHPALQHGASLDGR